MIMFFCSFQKQCIYIFKIKNYQQEVHREMNYKNNLQLTERKINTYTNKCIFRLL